MSACRAMVLQGTRKIVRMHGPLWDKVSSEAKELIRRLMAFDAGARLTVDQVWGGYRNLSFDTVFYENKPVFGARKEG